VLCFAYQVIIIHGINSALEVFVATRNGKQVPLGVPTKIYTQSILDTLPYPGVRATDPNLWFDPKQKRWVLVFTTVASENSVNRAPLVVAVSQTSNPLGTWTVWAIDGSANIALGLPFCSRAPVSDFVADYPQVGSAGNLRRVILCCASCCDVLAVLAPSRGLYVTYKQHTRNYEAQKVHTPILALSGPIPAAARLALGAVC
jgi:hypothetical protein